MISLAEHQAVIRDLIKGRLKNRPDDPYLTEVAESRGLAMIREIALWWRSFSMESYCVWTSKLLKVRGCFDEYVYQYFSYKNVSPFIETAGEEFLEFVSEDPDPLISSMARFELALI